MSSLKVRSRSPEARVGEVARVSPHKTRGAGQVKGITSVGDNATITRQSQGEIASDEEGDTERFGRRFNGSCFPLREFTAAEMGMHEHIFDHFNNTFRRQKAGASDSHKRSDGATRAYGPTLTYQSHDKGGRFEVKEDCAANQTGGFDPLSGSTQNRLIVKCALLFAIKQGTDTAAEFAWSESVLPGLGYITQLSLSWNVKWN